jgi:hypothetical protein
MILSDFILHSRVNAHWEYSGLDSFNVCLDKKHFKNYPYQVEYAYNSRGFRDPEWPESIEELKNSIWCIGDSFTVGLGIPFEHTWPYLLQQQTGRRCINVGMDGASNDWIARKTQSIINEISPLDIVVMWSYVHRRENKDTSLTDEARRQSERPESYYEDIQNYKMCVDSVQQIASKHRVHVKHSTIPNAISKKLFIETIQVYNSIRSPEWPDINNYTDILNLPLHILDKIKTHHTAHNLFTEINNIIELVHQSETLNIIEVAQLDWARDYHHVDILSNKCFVDKLVEQIC